jgi:hypothetical protein
MVADLTSIPEVFRVGSEFTGMVFGVDTQSESMTRVTYNKGTAVEVAYLSLECWLKQPIEDLTSRLHPPISDAVAITRDDVERAIEVARDTLCERVKKGEAVYGTLEGIAAETPACETGLQIRYSPQFYQTLYQTEPLEEETLKR